MARSQAGKKAERKRRGSPSNDENDLSFPSPEKRLQAVDNDQTPSKLLSSGFDNLNIDSATKRVTRSSKKTLGERSQNVHKLVIQDVDNDFVEPKRMSTTRNLFSSATTSRNNSRENSAEKKPKIIPHKPLKLLLQRVDGEYVIRAGEEKIELINLEDEKKNIKKTKRTTKQQKPKAPTLFDLRNILHTSEVPDRLPCRDSEFQNIYNFLNQAVSKNGTSQAMYISGVPGTGKTASTMAVMRKLASEGKKFIQVCVNAMELMEPKMLYVEVYNGITKNTKKISPSAASTKLNAMFQVVEKNRPPIILLVDELDQLVTKRQEIVYEVFNWTVFDEARITVIAIANTLDLPERMLNHRINSRMGANRLLFQPYTFSQIQEIVSDRLSELPEDVIAKEAIQLASQKIAAVSGDLRKAMDILRRATEIAMEKSSNKVDIQHVLDSCKEAASAVRVNLVKALPRHGVILFKSVISKLTSSGLDEVMFYDLYKEYCLSCRTLENIEPYHSFGLHSIMMRMCSNRLLKASPGMNLMRRRISLGMDMREAQFSIKQFDDLIKAGEIIYTVTN